MEDQQMCAFDLLATVAGKLLLDGKKNMEDRQIKWVFLKYPKDVEHCNDGFVCDLDDWSDDEIEGMIQDYTENWTAFAPDFKELEENEEYVEREDEFDFMPETEKVKDSDINEDEKVDILTTEKDSTFSDSVDIT